MTEQIRNPLVVFTTKVRGKVPLTSPKYVQMWTISQETQDLSITSISYGESRGEQPAFDLT